jgi:hypothetical protein
MDRMVRRKLTMMGRAFDFVRAHPSTDASWAALATRTEELLTRADALTVQERTGGVGERAAATRRRELRAQMQELLRHRVRVAEAASASNPVLVGEFEMPTIRGPHRIFVANAQAMLAAALPQRELFITFGLGDTLLAELEAATLAIETATVEFNAGRREHVGARAELKAIADSCMETAGRLDGLVRVRFRNDAEQLAAWESARNVDGSFTGRRAVVEEVPADAGGAAPAPVVSEIDAGITGAAPAPPAAAAPELPPQEEAA